jgi:23S rRNA pseudouridine1911/1915/1917 synthase
MTARLALGQEGKRLDRALLDLGLAGSRQAARELIAAGRVRVNGGISKKGYLVRADDRLELTEQDTPDRPVANPALTPAVLHEDAAVVVVAKAGLLPCHPLRLSETNTLMNGVVALYPETAEAGDNPREGGLVHRLDNGASGAVMIARSTLALGLLRQALRKNEIAREYQALALGKLGELVEIDIPIAHHASDPKRMTVVPAGSKRGWRGRPRAALTRVEPILTLNGRTLVRVIPRTGVRHQIRVHLAAAALPLVGDELYGAPREMTLEPGRFFLHLRRLTFTSPTGAQVNVEAPLPADLALTLESSGAEGLTATSR